MRFWDSSALVPLLVLQPASAAMHDLLDEDPEMVVWWGTPVECASAVARLRREGGITTAGETRVHELLDGLRDSWLEIQATSPVRDLAQRLLRAHNLRAGDALQLAAALTWAPQPRGDVLVTLDARLAESSRLQGFTAVPTS